MKRLIVLSLALTLLLSGCGHAVVTSSVTPAPAPAPTESPAPAAPAPTPVPTLPPETFPFDYAETLADTEDFSFAVTALGVDPEENWVVHLRLENRSDEIMNFRLLWQSINGLAIDDLFTYRVAVGGVSEQSFRILKEELAAWGFEEPVQWSFTLRVSSAESNREDYFLGELSASPFGEEKAVRYEYVPGPHDYIVMDNDYATVYVTGWQPEDGGLSVDYVAVNRCEKPLRLVLPEKQLLLDGRRMSAELSDSFGAYATLFGYIPVEGWEGEPPLELQLCLALEDPGAKKDALLEDTVTEIVLCR